MQDERFEWDDAKADRNRRKHGITFDEARSVFDDPAAIDDIDMEAAEERWRRIGRAPSGLLLVIHTERRDRIRIISARKANRHEQDLYYRQAQP